MSTFCSYFVKLLRLNGQSKWGIFFTIAQHLQHRLVGIFDLHRAAKESKWKQVTTLAQSRSDQASVERAGH